MNFTDGYFRFPVKMYDGWELTKAIIKEEKELEANPDDAELGEASWIECWQRVKFSQILGWSENFSRERDFAEIQENGPDLTTVETEHMGELPCTWKIKEFEEKLNAAYNRFVTNSINKKDETN